MNSINKLIDDNKFEILINNKLIGIVEKIDGLWYWYNEKETSVSFTNFLDARHNLLVEKRNNYIMSTYDPTVEHRYGINKYKKDDGFKHPYKK
jgi:hypothetical protein